MTVAVDVRDLVTQPGAYRTVRVRERLQGLRTELVAVPEETPVEAELLMESVVEGVLASGPVEGTMRISCARCLAMFDSPFHVDVRELFSPDARPEDDEYPLVEGIADVEPLLRDAVMGSMPFAPLCRPDCLGLCERCGGDRNLGQCTCPEESDPRWSALLDIRFPEGE